MKLTSPFSLFSFLFLICSMSHFQRKAAFSGRPAWSSEKFRILLQALKRYKLYIRVPSYVILYLSCGEREAQATVYLQRFGYRDCDIIDGDCHSKNLTRHETEFFFHFEPIFMSFHGKSENTRHSNPKAYIFIHFWTLINFFKGF